MYIECCFAFSYFCIRLGRGCSEITNLYLALFFVLKKYIIYLKDLYLNFFRLKTKLQIH